MNIEDLKNNQSGISPYAEGQNNTETHMTEGQTPPQEPQSEQIGKIDVQRIAENDLKTIQNLVNSGKIDNAQGQYLVNFVINKALNMAKSQDFQPVPQPAQETNTEENFNFENSDFFKQSGRAEVLDYLKNSNVNFDQEEISKISNLVETIENNAVERYLKQIAHEKTLNEENEIAKSRLRANAQNANFDDNKNMVFTREQIGKMSGADFAKNEKAIMEQLRKGLIR